jgi:hypothetical protein
MADDITMEQRRAVAEAEARAWLNSEVDNGNFWALCTRQLLDEQRRDAMRWRWIAPRLCVHTEETLRGTRRPFLQFEIGCGGLPVGTATFGGGHPDKAGELVDAQIVEEAKS